MCVCVRVGECFCVSGCMFDFMGVFFVCGCGACGLCARVGWCEACVYMCVVSGCVFLAFGMGVFCMFVQVFLYCVCVCVGVF